VSGDYDVARFLLASGAFGDSLNHAFKTELEGLARQFLYGLDKSSELNIKANLLKRYSEDEEGSFASRMVMNGIFPTFVEEAWKNFESARDALNDLLSSSNKEPISEEIFVNLDSFKLKPYLQECFSFERFELHQKNEHNLREMVIEGQFYARTLTINYRRFLFDVVAMNPPKRHRHQHQHQRRRRR
jgi:hypothetical protein